MFGIPALASARKAAGFLLLPILFALVGLLALMATQVYGQSTVPSKPASFSATAGDSRVTISWNDPNAPTITNYQYRRSIDGGNNWSPNWADLPGSGASTVTHVFNDVVPGLTYVSPDTRGEHPRQQRGDRPGDRHSDDVDCQIDGPPVVSDFSCGIRA